MIASILSQVTGQLEKRFILNAFFPVLVFALAVGATITAGIEGPVAAIEAWEADSGGAKALLAIAAVAGVFLLANLLSNAMQQVIIFFEGYRLPMWLTASARRRQLSRASRLLKKAQTGVEQEREEAADRFQLTFPVWPQKLTADDVAPTRLGNVLQSAESYPMQRYGVDSVRIWPRLSPLIAEPILSSMTAARTSMEFLLAVSLLSGIYAPLGSIYLIICNVDLALVLVALAVGTLISICTYLAALGPAAIYGEQIRTAFDLHRHLLLSSVGMPTPATLEEERRLWGELLRFLDRGEAIDTWRYVIAADDA